MSKMPKMNLWIDAFNSDTSFLSDEELGIYFRLIFFAWGREGYLPKDIEFIASLTRNANKEAIQKVLHLYWTDDGEKYYQKRLREEYLRAVEVTEKAKKSAEIRWGDTNAMPSHSERNASISISKSKSISNSNILNHFESFWEDVCYKISKGQAKKNFAKLPKEWLEKPKELSDLYNKYYNALKDKQYAQHPSTWLNAEGFLNQGISVKEKSEKEMKEWKFKSDIEMRKKGIKPLSWSVGYIRELDEFIAKSGGT